MYLEYLLSTNEEIEWINIDRYLKEAIYKSGVQEGIAIIYCPHTTAGISINENADPHVISDINFGLDQISPKRKEYRHAEGNSSAHLKASLVGSSQSVIISNSRPLLGMWQSVYFCEFDGPRPRKLCIKIIGSRDE